VPKLFEKCLLTRLIPYLGAHNVIPAHQSGLSVVERWLSDWRIKINEQKCKHITLTLNRQTCPPLSLNNTQIPQVNDVTYLGVHLDRRLTWRRHIERKKVRLKLKASSFHWILNAHSPLLYNSTLKPIWTYDTQLWGNASSSNIDIIQRVQSKILRTITGATWYIRNQNIHRDLGILTVKDEIDQQKASYNEKLSVHPWVSSRSRQQRNDLPSQQ